MLVTLRASVCRAGREVLDRLCRDRKFQQYLSYIDQQAPHKASCGGGDADVEMIAQQRLSRIDRDIQRRVKRMQDSETAFRL